MDLLDRAASLRDMLVALRREVHANPELGFEEAQTGDLVQEVLAQLGYSKDDISMLRAERVI